MRLHTARVPSLAAEMVSALTSAGDIECESEKEVRLDVEAVLNQYIRDEQEISEKAKDLLASRGLPQSQFSKIRQLVADERKVKLGEDAIDYLLDQLVEMLMHSNNVDEIYSEDYELRRKLREPLRQQIQAEQQLEADVRGQLKHVREGTNVWEIEYRRMMEDMKRRKGF